MAVLSLDFNFFELAKPWIRREWVNLLIWYFHLLALSSFEKWSKTACSVPLDSTILWTANSLNVCKHFSILWHFPLCLMLASIRFQSSPMLLSFGSGLSVSLISGGALYIQVHPHKMFAQGWTFFCYFCLLTFRSSGQLQSNYSIILALFVH